MLKDEAKLARHLQIVMHDWPKDAKQNTIDHVLSALKEQRLHERDACAEIAREFGRLPHGHVPASGLSATYEAARQIAEAIENRPDA
jgi:hypothetical protein